jgi:1,2-dihydroxy-3-keto-5-methylthiopentene dioxygenase
MRAHFLDGDEEISVERLAAEGVKYEQLGLEPRAFEAPLAKIKNDGGYVHQDEVALRPDNPNLDAICAKFIDEHTHTEDEVRFVLEGAGIFDIRSKDDRWMRVTVEPGDLLVVPRDRHHRFFLTEARTIRCVRLFQDAAGWTPHYRRR